jgi:type VI protein secretion system component VasK
VPQTSNSAIVALVLSIVSWVICPVWITGGGLVTASKIVAWINIGFYAAIAAILLIIVLIAAAGGALT